MLESVAYPTLYQESAGRKTADKAINILQGRTVGGSTTSGWPSFSLIFCDKVRANKSVAPPAGNGTISRTGLLGYDCACTKDKAGHTNAMAKAARIKARKFSVNTKHDPIVQFGHSKSLNAITCRRWCAYCDRPRRKNELEQTPKNSMEVRAFLLHPALMPALCP
eukprot:gene22572-28703_t